MIELAQPDPQELVVVILAGVGRRELHTDVVLGKAMHGTATGGLLEEHLGFRPPVAGVKGLRLLVGKFKQAAAALLLRALIDHIGNAERRRARAF